MADKIEKETLVRAFNKAPGEAVDYLAKKVSRSSWNWWDSLDKSFEGSCTIAATASADIVESVRKALLEAQAKGLPFAAFQKQIEPTLRSLGWWGRDPATGSYLGTPWRLETIYRTNLQSSFNAGRMQKQQQTERFRPLLEYIAVLDSKTRPSHSALDGKVVPASDSFWNDFYPPNGFNCRCRVRSLSEAEARRDGKDVDRFDGKITREEETINKDLGIKTEVAVVNVGGRVVSPDPGFSRRPSIVPPPPNPSGGKYPTTGPTLAAKVAAAPKKAKAKAAAVVPPAIVPGPKVAPKNLDEMLKVGVAQVKKNIGEIDAAQNPFKFEDSIDGIGAEYLDHKGRRFYTYKQVIKDVESVFSKEAFFEQIEEFHNLFTLTSGGGNARRLTTKRKFDSALSDNLGKYLSEHLRERIKTKIPGYDSLTEQKKRIEEGRVLGLHSLKQNLPENAILSKKLPPPPPSKNRAGFNPYGDFDEQEVALKRALSQADEIISDNFDASILPGFSDFERLNIATEQMNPGVGAYYRDSERAIRIRGNSPATDITHEFLHFVHYQSDRIKKTTTEFFTRRVKDERLFNHSSYGWTADDKFFEAYQGRTYQRAKISGGKVVGEMDPQTLRATENPSDYSVDKFGGVELLTRSLDLMVERPLDFFVGDAETFSFVRSVLLGDLPE